MSGSPSSFLGKAMRILQSRPTRFFLTVRGWFLFKATRWLSRIFPLPGVVLGKNVRLQRLRCLMAEAPEASIHIQDHTIIYENARIEAYEKGMIQIGDCSILGDIRIQARERIQIGKRFLSSWNVFISDFEPHPIEADLRGFQVEMMVEQFRPRFAGAHSDNALSTRWTSKAWAFPKEAIEIGDDVWVGANATILKGAKIGKGCIVATGSVVIRGTYPEHSVLAGNPAKVVKTI